MDLESIWLALPDGHNINEFLDTLYPNSHITGKVRDSLGMETWEHLQERVKACMDTFNHSCLKAIQNNRIPLYQLSGI